MVESETDVAIERAKVQPNSRSPHSGMPKPAYMLSTLAAPVGNTNPTMGSIGLNKVITHKATKYKQKEEEITATATRSRNNARE